MSVYEHIIVELGAGHQYTPDAPVENINEISDKAIVCFTHDREPVRYGDNTWNFKAYCSRSVTIYTFTGFPELSSELKKVIYARLYFSPKSRSVTSVSQTPVNQLALWASNNNTSLFGMLNEKRFYPFLAYSFSKLSKRSSSILLSVIHELRKIRIIHPDFQIAPPDDELGELLEKTSLAQESADNNLSEQTAVIPSRLYSSLIRGFEWFLNNYLAHSGSIYKFFESLQKGFEKRPNFISELKKAGEWEPYLQDHELLEFSQQHDLRNKKDFSTYLMDVQNVARLWVHIFTGMRKTEVDTLPYKCFEELTTHGIRTKIISGRTSKLSGQNAVPTFWVTTDIIEIGIRAAQSIGQLLSSDRGYKVHDNDYPLFPQFQTRKGSDQGCFPNAPYSTLYTASALKKRILERFPELRVTEEDLMELELFDGFRDWRSKCPPGEPWPLATHQLRRSLAVYLARSGLVSIGSMQVQYKHLCAAMTSYYRKGSTFAVNFIDSDDSDDHKSQILFVEAMEQERKLAEYLDYEEKVIENQGNLWGGEGKRISRAYNKGQPLIIVTDRDETQKRFEKGEMAYKRSPIGGCTKVGSCNRLSITRITACIDCEYSTLDENSLPEIQRQVDNLIFERDQYKSESLLYQHTQDVIDELKYKVKKAGKSL